MSMNIHLIQPAERAVTPPLQQCLSPMANAAGGGESAEPIAWDNLTSSGEDRSFAQPVSFAWETDADSNGNRIYELTISRYADMREPLVLIDLRDPRAEVLHLHIGTTYYWSVRTHGDGDQALASRVGSFTTHAATPRWINVPGITNVRDVGGWSLANGRAVRQGLIYRGSEMDSHVIISDEGRRVLENELGIRTDLDLRGTGEVAGPVLDTDKVHWLHIPVLPYDNITTEEQKAQYRLVFTALADDANYPLYFHCWGGADRGGTVAFLLGAVLGKRFEDLALEFELTTFSIWGTRSRDSDDFQNLLGVLRAAAPDGTVNRQAEQYLLDTGITPDQIAAIRSNLIE